MRPLNLKFSKAKLIEGVFVGLIFVVAIGTNLYLNLNTPIGGDSARDAVIIEQITESGKISPTLRYWMGTPQANLPIFYPQLYYVLVATLEIFIGDIALILVPALAGAFLIVANYILARLIGGFKTGILVLMSSLAFTISNTGVEPEMVISFLTVLCLTSFFKLMETGQKRWLIATSVPVAGVIAMKQEGWFAILFIVIGSIVYTCIKWRKLRYKILMKGAMIIAMALMLCSATLWYQFSTTGYLSYPGVLPQPLAKVEGKVAADLHISRYEVNSDFLKYGRASNIVADRKDQASLQGTLKFLNPFSQPQEKEVLTGFFVFGSVLGIAFMLRRRNVKALIITFFLLVLLVINCVFLPYSVRSYFGLLPVLWSLVPAYGLVMIARTISPLTNSRVYVPIVTLIVLLFIVGCSLAATKQYTYRLSISIGSQQRQQEYQEMGLWIRKNLPENAIILDHRADELSQYAHRRVIWIFLIGGTELYEALNFGSEQQLIGTMQQQDVFYIFIDKKWVGDPSYWISCTAPEAVSMLESSAHFKKIFYTKTLALYELMAK